MNNRTTSNDPAENEAHRYEELVRVCPNGIAFCSNGKVVEANPSLLRILGRSADSLLGCELSTLLSPEVSEETLRKLNALRHSGAGHEVSCRTKLMREDQSAIDVDASTRHLNRSYADSVVVFQPLAIFQNAHIMSNEESLQRAHMLKMSVFGELTAALIHELGQPVTAAAGARDLILDSNEDLATVESRSRASELLLSSVSGIAGKFRKIWNFVRTRKPALQTECINTICQEGVNTVEQSAQHSGVGLAFSGDTELTANIDSSLVHLIVVSLLHRSVLALALNAEAERKIQITTSRENANFVAIEISHPGLSLSHEEKNASDKRPEETPECNLTLSTCRLIAEENGGLFLVHPEPVGVRYQLLLPG